MGSKSKSKTYPGRDSTTLIEMAANDIARQSAEHAEMMSVLRDVFLMCGQIVAQTSPKTN